MIGEKIKVLLPGERPWVEVIADVGSMIKGRLLNKCFHEFSEHEQAQWMKQEFGDVESLPQLHEFKKGDEIWFVRGEGNSEGWWVPAKIEQSADEKGQRTDG